MTAPDQQQQDDTRDAVIAALVLWFASAAAIAATLLPAALVARLVALGLSVRAVRAAAQITMAPPLTGRRSGGSPRPTPGVSTKRATAAEEPTMRAQYLVKASERLTEAEKLGVFPQALRLEEGYLKQHTAAGRNRARAAAELDRVAAEHGPWLVWVTKNDARVEPQCRELSGTVFTADNPPKGFIPGAVHVNCRCVARGLTDRLQPAPTIQADQRGNKRIDVLNLAYNPDELRIGRGVHFGGRWTRSGRTADGGGDNTPDLLGHLRANNGFTYDPRGGRVLNFGDVPGYAVAIPGTEQLLGGSDITREEFRTAFRSIVRQQAMQHPRAVIGGSFTARAPIRTGAFPMPGGGRHA